METIHHLDCIGARVAGTPCEAKAARWIEQQFRRLNLINIHRQDFPCLSFGHTNCLVSILTGNRWRRIASEPAAHSPATPVGGIEGELIFVEKVPSDALAFRSMQGKMLLIYGSELFQLKRLQQVMESKPAGILLVDDRFPNDWTVAVGFPRYWVNFITCPVVNIPYMVGWRIVSEQVKAVRLNLQSSVKRAKSQNVIGEIAGDRFPEKVIVISAHHDTVPNNPGADDNGSGIAVMLELARTFAAVRSRRTLRFISFGTEEQLSEGAKHYAFGAGDVSQIQMAVNIDSVGAWMGQTRIYCVGTKALRKTIEQINNEMAFPGHIISEVSPFSDHFPLNLQGVPGVWYYRTTFGSARHYHHSVLETVDVVSPWVLERTVRAIARLLEVIANSEPMPFPRTIPAVQKRALNKMAKQWTGINMRR
ncbi:MAG TPA: M28 family metallopeptidase [Acidobacteriota bacterium]